jgi:intracellular sulfur oxidation DsrE/DsrF family protein
MSNSIAVVIDKNGSQLHGLLDVLDGAENPPVQLLFHTEAVSLATDESPVLDELRELEARGVSLLACGACLGYAGLRDRLAVGRVCSIERMMEVMESAGTVVVL